MCSSEEDVDSLRSKAPLFSGAGFPPSSKSLKSPEAHEMKGSASFFLNAKIESVDGDARSESGQIRSNIPSDDEKVEKNKNLAAVHGVKNQHLSFEVCFMCAFRPVCACL